MYWKWDLLIRRPWKHSSWAACRWDVIGFIPLPRYQIVSKEAGKQGFAFPAIEENLNQRYFSRRAGAGSG